MKISSPDSSVLAVYLFGSTANGKTSKLSDIDVAVLLRKQPSDLNKIKLKLISKFIDIFKSDKIDLVILNEAPLLLAFEVISSGKMIFGIRNDVADFEARTSSLYHDRKYYYDRYADEMIKRVVQKGLR